MKIRYVGPADVRLLVVSDLKRIGVQDAEVGVEFARGVDMDVPTEFGQTLLESPLIAGEFEVSKKVTIDDDTLFD